MKAGRPLAHCAVAMVFSMFALAAAQGQAPAPATSAATPRTRAMDELQRIRAIALGKQAVDKVDWQTILDTPLTQSCADPVVEGMKFHICNLTPDGPQTKPIQLAFAKVSGQYGAATQQVEIHWTVGNGALCMTQQDLIDLFHVRPSRNRNVGTRDSIAGINTLPHFNDYELILPTPDKAHHNQDNYLYVAENKRCVTGFTLHTFHSPQLDSHHAN